jgi:FtsH-binding integral membrane protein
MIYKLISMTSWVHGFVIWLFYFAVSTDKIVYFRRLFWAIILTELAMAFWVNIPELR